MTAQPLLRALACAAFILAVSVLRWARPGGGNQAGIDGRHIRNLRFIFRCFANNGINVSLVALPVCLAHGRQTIDSSDH